MFFDLHSDILYDIVQKKLNNKKNIIKDYHLKQLKSGNIIGGIWDYYTDIRKPLCEFNQAIDYILEEIEQSNDVIQVIKKKEDFEENKINVLLGFESLQPIKDRDHLVSLYELGFRHAMFTWNEQNQFGTGVFGDKTRGLTSLGKEIIQLMNQNHMIIDVSHANKKTFKEIIELSKAPVIASHSNVYQLCHHIRNLDDEQITKLTQKGGIIGLTAVKNFINPNNPTINEMINHIDYMKERNLVNHIGFGFDFMDYLNGSNLIDLENASSTHNMIVALKKRNYSPQEIDKITHLNAINLIKQILK